MKNWKNVPILLAILVFTTILTSVLSRYPGSISLEWRLDGGRVEINGNPSSAKASEFNDKQLAEKADQ